MGYEETRKMFSHITFRKCIAPIFVGVVNVAGEGILSSIAVTNSLTIRIHIDGTEVYNNESWNSLTLNCNFPFYKSLVVELLGDEEEVMCWVAYKTV